MEGSIFATTRNRRVISIDVCSLDVSAPMRMKPRLEASMEPVLGADAAASVPARVPARTLPAGLSPPPTTHEARVPSKMPPGMPSSTSRIYVVRSTGAEPQGFCATEWGSVPGETSEELSESEYGTPAPDVLPYNPYALKCGGRFNIPPGVGKNPRGDRCGRGAVCVLWCGVCCLAAVCTHPYS